MFNQAEWSYTVCERELDEARDTLKQADANVTEKQAAYETAKANYEASLPVSIKGAKITVKAQTYTGKALKPAVTVTLNGKTLKKGTDYTVSYKNNLRLF